MGCLAAAASSLPSPHLLSINTPVIAWPSAARAGCERQVNPETATAAAAKSFRQFIKILRSKKMRSESGLAQGLFAGHIIVPLVCSHALEVDKFGEVIAQGQRAEACFASRGF